MMDPILEEIYLLGNIIDAANSCNDERMPQDILDDILRA